MGEKSDGLTELALESELGNLAKGAFIMALGHRLREPMNSVAGMLRLLDSSDLNPHQREHIESALTACDAMVGILDEVSAFPVGSYDIPLERAPFNVYKASKEIMRALETTARSKSISIAFECDDDVPEFILGDKLKLQQVLAKILEHLIARTEKGGVEMLVSNENGGKLVFKAVSTSSEFLDASSIDEIIDFASDKWEGDSISRRASLELAVCAAIAEKMGGNLDFSDSPASLSVAIPMETPSQEALDEICGVDDSLDKEESWAPVAPGRFNGTRILLAEDDPINQSLGVAFLTNLGANVDVADNGKEAVDKFVNNEYDIVFMDCDMPVMDGFDATRRIREMENGKEPKTPIVAMTAYARQGDKESCIAAGMDAHVPKPITVDILKELADKFL